MDKYIEMYKEMHKQDKMFCGHKTRMHLKPIKELVKITQSKLILDYGSGKGKQYSEDRLDEYWQCKVVCYDPGYEPFNNLPKEKHDGVICIDVLEHVPEERVEEVLKEIFSRAKKFVYLCIATFPSKKNLPNGENCHITVKAEDWWISKIEKVNTDNIKLGLNFNHGIKDGVRKNRPRTLKIFVGYDPIEQLSFDVYSHSLNKLSSRPLSITQLRLSQLKEEMWRPWHPKQSNEFAFSRFLVPYLSNYEGWALFTDCDFLARTDIAELFSHADDRYACMVTKHNYVIEDGVKFLNRPQSKYERKNWSSCVLWNCAHPANQILEPRHINELDTPEKNVGLWLHQFGFLEDELIGELPLEWNHLVDIYPHNPNAKMVHWTNHGPWLDGHNDVDFGGEWFTNMFEMLNIRRK